MWRSFFNLVHIYQVISRHLRIQIIRISSHPEQVRPRTLEKDELCRQNAPAIAYTPINLLFPPLTFSLAIVAIASSIEEDCPLKSLFLQFKIGLNKTL